MHVSQEAAERKQYLTFQVAGAEYAVGILRVREIINHREPTRVPMTPPHVPGVINLRGLVVPLVDLALEFGAEPTVVTRRTCIVIVELCIRGETTAMGLLVDAVNEVAEIGPDEIQPPPPLGLGISADLLLGLGRVEQRFVPILDLDRVLVADAELSASLVGPTEGEAEVRT